MQIHQLPEQQTVSDSDMFALDTGQTTRRTPFSVIKTAVSTFAHQLTNLAETTATSDSDVLQIDDGTGAKKITFGNLKNRVAESATPAFNSVDASSSYAWTSVAVLASGEALTSVYNKISAMFKNIRFLYYKIGNNNVSGTGKSSLTAIIGNTSIVSIGNGTLSGAVSTINAALTPLVTNLEANTITTDAVNSLTGRATYIAQISNTTAAAIGLPSSWFYVLNISRPTSDGWCFQVFFEVGGTTRVYVRNSTASAWNAVKQLQFVS